MCNDRGNIRRLLPQLAERKLTDLRLHDIEKIHGLMKATPYHADRVLALISHMFTKAVEWELCDESPIKRGTVKKLKFGEDKHPRPLNDEEQAHPWQFDT